MPLPKHQIDSSVLVELLLKPTRKSKALQHKVRGYIESKVGKQCDCVISISALGEIIYAVRKNIADSEKQLDAIRELFAIIDAGSIKFNYSEKASFDLALKLLSDDLLIKPADALRVAESIVSNAVLVTIDGEIAKSLAVRRAGAKIFLIEE